ncbi:glycosyltransferase [Desulfococcaceae bacterium HSG7]|nr:glycosyltransferase [Desulfococcaceae bacterium HSG7]
MKNIKLTIRRRVTDFFQKKKIAHQNHENLSKNGKIVQYSEADYDQWLEKHQLTNTKKKWIKQTITAFEFTPLISIIMPVYKVDPAWLDKAICSVQKQLYSNWELCIADDASDDDTIRELLLKYSHDDPRIKIKFLSRNRGIATASNEAVFFSAGQYLGLLDHDDEISADALYENVKFLNRCPDAQLIYSDKDKIDMAGNRLNPFFKPDYSPDLLLSQNYICHFNVIAEPLFTKIGGFRKGFEGSQDHDLFLRIAEQTDKIYHIPKILYHWRIIPDSAASGFGAKPLAWEAGRKAVQDSLRRRQIKGNAVCGKFNGTYRVQREVLQKPLVSIIISVNNKERYFKQCVATILEKTQYPFFEVIGVSDYPAKHTLKIKKNFGKSNKNIEFVKSVEKFITSKDLNQAAKRARGRYIIFLSDGLEIVTAGWIEALAEHSQRNEVGAVGGKYYLPDGRLVHAGILIGIAGGIGYSHKSFHKDDVGYYARTHIIRNVSGVAGACMMVEKNLFEQIGGFDEKNFPHTYYDIDFCLRLRKKGYLNIFTPYCEAVFHHPNAGESEKSNEYIKQKQREINFFKERWKDSLAKGDPYYNPNFAFDQADFAFKF